MDGDMENEDIAMQNTYDIFSDSLIQRYMVMESYQINIAEKNSKISIQILI